MREEPGIEEPEVEGTSDRHIEGIYHVHSSYEAKKKTPERQEQGAEPEQCR